MTWLRTANARFLSDTKRCLIVTSTSVCSSSNWSDHTYTAMSDIWWSDHTYTAMSDIWWSDHTYTAVSDRGLPPPEDSTVSLSSTRNTSGTGLTAGWHTGNWIYQPLPRHLSLSRHKTQSDSRCQWRWLPISTPGTGSPHCSNCNKK